MNRSLPHKSHFLALYFLVAMALPSLSVAQSDAESYAQYTATRDLSIRIFAAAHKKFSNRLRAAAILQACNKVGVANSVDVTTSEKVKFISGEMVRLNDSDSKAATILSTLTTQEKINLTSNVSDQLIAYQYGYKEAISTLKNSVPEICEAGVQEADSILKERK